MDNTDEKILEGFTESARALNERLKVFSYASEQLSEVGKQLCKVMSQVGRTGITHPRSKFFYNNPPINRSSMKKSNRTKSKRR